MAYLLKISDSEFYLCDKAGEKLLSLSNEHSALLHFIDADLSELPSLLNDYFVNPKNDEINNFCMDRIREVLYNTHPFFECDANETIAAATADLLIASLINKTYDDKNNAFSKIYDFDSFSKKLWQLLPDCDDEEIRKYYGQYVQHINWETSLPPLPPKPFYSLLSYQDYLRGIVYWVLDKSAPLISKLTLNERIALFGEIFQFSNDEPHTAIKKRISFSNPHHSDNVNEFRNNLFDYRTSLEKIDKQTKSFLLTEITKVKGSNSSGFFEEYEIDSIFDLLFLEIERIMKNDTLVKRCRNCNCYFVPKNLNTEYCSSPVSEGSEKICADVGSQNSFKKKLDNDPQLLVYNRAYKKYFNRVTVTKTMTKSEFNVWQQTARAKLDAFRIGELSLSEFEKWFGVKNKKSPV